MFGNVCKNIDKILTLASRSNDKQYQWPLIFGTRTCNGDRSNSKSPTNPLFHSDPSIDPTCCQISCLQIKYLRDFMAILMINPRKIDKLKWKIDDALIWLGCMGCNQSCDDVLHLLWLNARAACPSIASKSALII